ncbi:MFS transporter [Tunturiibacter empetritectus]|uniref:MFS transporter n=1 Tax=Tunturiibacter empetritectus TaxID=3069691 RepID=UPI003D9BD52D
MRKPERSFWQIWNMSFGFLGIQFGWGLQMANMSAIYEYLGARADQIPILWLAAPLTGLLIQPIIGNASDHTWGPLGRRRPYFLVGAILSSLMLLFMPNCSSLWMAAGMLWILDASINVSMEPFRAFVADILPEGQRTRGFAMQSLFIGLGAVIASALPWLLTNVFHMTQVVGDTRAVPTTVRISFYIGAVAYLGAVLWTIFTTPEYPPRTWKHFAAPKRESRPDRRRKGDPLRNRPHSGDHAQARSRPALHLARSLLHVALLPRRRRPQRLRRDRPRLTPLQRRHRVGRHLLRSLLCRLLRLLLRPALARQKNREKKTHTACLLCGAIGLISVVVMHNKYMLLFTMLGVGIAWASTLSMPYAMLAATLPRSAPVSTWASSTSSSSRPKSWPRSSSAGS